MSRAEVFFTVISSLTVSCTIAVAQTRAFHVTIARSQEMLLAAAYGVTDPRVIGPG